ncbi:hypothetical protein BIS06_11855 [Halomonas sp. BBD48]|nr:hypothetical protein [Halomonas sp. BBD48]
MPAGARVLPIWSNIHASAEFTFETVDPGYVRRARERGDAGHVIVAGDNYGQGSSRENAALVPRFLGLQVVIARSIARIHWQNLPCFGVLPLTFEEPTDLDRLQQGDRLHIVGLRQQLAAGQRIIATLNATDTLYLHHELSPRQQAILSQGGVINWLNVEGRT